MFWWADPAVQKEVGLNPKQIADLQKLWDTTQPVLKAKQDEVSKESKEVDRLVREGSGEEVVLKLHIDRLEAYRSQWNSERLLMDWRMHRLLTTDQNVKLKAIADRRGRDGRGGGPRDFRHP